MAGAGDFAEGGEGEDLFQLGAPDPALEDPGETVPLIGDFDPDQDRLELRYEDDGDGIPPEVTLDLHPDGSTLVRMDGLAVGKLLGVQGLRVSDITLTAIRPAA